MMGLSDVQAKMDDACQQAGRDSAGISLIAVSKLQPLDRIRAVLDEGHRQFGENRVQEAQEKWPALKEKYPGISLHFIGHLQSNKAKEAVELFDCIETLDNRKLADELQNEMVRQRRVLPCFIQVNTGEEAQKSGVTPKDLEPFFAFAKEEAGLDITGLMCIPPQDEPPEPHFALLHKLGREIGLPYLSMGMSSDFEAAIRCGSTHVRVGSAIFGERQV